MERREQDDSYSHVLKYTGIFGGVQGLAILVALLRNKLTARLLGEAGMGLNKRFMTIYPLSERKRSVIFILPDARSLPRTPGLPKN